MAQKTMKQLSEEFLTYLEERGNTKNGQANYRYILNIMTEYCDQHNEGYYSNEALADCIAEHYGIDDINAYKSRSHPHKNKICRIVRALSDLNDGTMPKDRYITTRSLPVKIAFNAGNLAGTQLDDTVRHFANLYY